MQAPLSGASGNWVFLIFACFKLGWAFVGMTKNKNLMGGVI